MTSPTSKSSFPSLLKERVLKKSSNSSSNSVSVKNTTGRAERSPELSMVTMLITVPFRPKVSFSHSLFPSFPLSLIPSFPLSLFLSFPHSLILSFSHSLTQTKRKQKRSALAIFASTNPLHPEVFPSIRKFESEIIAMTLNLLANGVDGACGAVTSGGTESILMAVKAHRDYYRTHKGITQPEMFVLWMIDG